MTEIVDFKEKDRIIMQLVHYFVTKENYSPILVNGVKNEIWLENLNSTYKIIRINSNYIHNKEQLNFDLYKIKNVVKQIKRKTVSFSMPALNILLDVNEDVKVQNEKNIDTLIINDYSNFKDEMGILSMYPQILNDEVKGENLEFFINVTNDINKKTEDNNSFYEKVFSKKYPVITYALIAINIIMYCLAVIGELTGKFDLYTMLAVQKNHLQNMELYRLITGAFMHSDIMHLFCNMYSLYILGPELESFIGKKKFAFIYFISLLAGNLLAAITSTAWCVGASGAIFGLLGGLLYFGYHYRIYLGGALKQQIIPVILINLFISFMIPSISLSAHIGGLVGGLFAALAVGVERKSEKSDNINGIIVLTIFLVFLLVMLFR